ncbi:hypothetical protein JCM5350_006427 [Sporobolomyces pararoseus]
MALVSSISPPTSLYPGSPSLHSHSRATTSDSSTSNPTLVRKLPSPTPPPLSTSPTTTRNYMNSSPTKVAGQQQRREGSGSSSGGGGGGYSNSQFTSSHAPRQDSSTSSSSPGYGLSAGGGGTGGGSSPSSSSNSVRLPSPLPPSSRSSSTPPSPARPAANPLPNHQGSSYHHQHSSSSSSIPRIAPPAQYQSQGHQQTNYMAHPQLAHPSFVGQSFSPFAPPHAFAHPAFPFVPSPHPSQNGATNNYVSYSPNGQLTPGGSAEQQKRMQAFQQAQWAAAANQMEMLRNQQQGTHGQDGRKRTTSGPASSSPTFYTTPLPYPSAPSPNLHQNALQFGQNPSFPAGAMLPHGYPTPPGSVEGVVRGGESGGSSSGGSREGGYHPYRRDHHHHPTAKSSSSESGTRSSSTPRSSHSTTPSTSSNSSHRVPVPKLATQGRSESVQAQPFPRSHASSPSLTSVRSLTLPTSSSQPQLSAPAYASRPRTQSSNSSSSSLHRPQYEPLPVSSGSPSSARPRTTSFESARSSTPQTQQNRPRPSPLGGVHQPLPVDSDEDSDDGADSDGTAEATATVNSATIGSAGVSRSPTMNSMATIKTTAPPTAVGSGGKGKEKEKEKEKEKKGMASRFKKAFGGGGGNSNSSSSTTLTEAEVDGRGPKGTAFRKPRSDSVSSSETSTNPRTPPSAHHAHQPSIASMASSSTRTMNGDADSTRKAPSSRFRLLNSKLNSSTDNISISSTVSSASVMIRKLGQMGKLARRNSLMGLTKAFKKDKNKDGQQDEEDPLKSTSLSSKKDKKGKSDASLASVSHATAEVESSPNRTSTGMSPAAALAKRQQMHYAEQEAAAEAKARALAAEEAAKLGPPRGQHGRTDSDVASVKSGKSGRWGIGRSKTTDDVTGERSQNLEKEKEKLKSRSKFGRLGFGGSKTDLHSSDTASVIDDASSITGTGRGGSALGLYQNDDSTARQSLEILAPPQSYATYGGETVRRDSSSDYEPSLYRQGATPANAQVRAVKGILKGAGTYSQEQYAKPRPSFHRIRASSFDAPQQQGRPGSPGNAALVNVIPSQAQVDGVAPSSTSPRSDTHPPTSTEQIHDSAVSRVENGGSMYGNPSMNASAPVLSHFTAQTATRSNSAPGATGRRIAFAANLSVHTTWPAAIYDRRAEPATCNRLTPTLAQQIKEELNSFKMEEMDVHPDSRKLTHFFV